MSVHIQLRRGTAAAWTAANPTLAEGEMGLETDTGKFKVGDGLTVWASLVYSSGVPGDPGDPGADGKTVRSGAGAPAGGLGVDGDFYIDTTVNAIYGPKTGGAWGSATSLIGPEGDAGPGVPAGGTTGQRLAKASDTDYDTEWVTPSGSSITIAEIDGAPSVTASTLQFPNGTLTDEGGGVARYTPAAAGLSSATPLVESGGGAAGTGTSASRDDHVHPAAAAAPARPYLDTLTLDATYGDDFDAATLDAKWTAHSLVAGRYATAAEDGSQLAIVHAASGELMLQDAPTTDEWEAIVDATVFRDNTNCMWGIVALTSAGGGIVGGVNPSNATLAQYNMVAYAYGSTATSLALNVFYDARRRMWLSLRRKKATDGALGTQPFYLIRYSTDGITWSPNCYYLPSTFTLAKIGFGIAVSSAVPTDYRASVGRWNVINHLNVGNNLVRHPTAGSASYSASTQYSSDYQAAYAADGGTSNSWVRADGNSTGWWMVTWTSGQSLNRVRILNRGGASAGICYVELSDGASTWSYPVPDYVTGTNWSVIDLPSTLTGITTLKVVAAVTSGVFGFGEVEAYLAS